MNELESLIHAARDKNLSAYGVLVNQSQSMVYAVCMRILSCEADAMDAAQETFLRAFRRLDDLQAPAAWPGWLRRIAITTARNTARRKSRSRSFLSDEANPPVLDELENHWTDEQRLSLSRALLTLSPEDRRVCDRFYHGGWTTARLATDASVNEATMRKRLQRIRDRLRQEIEMSERPTQKLTADLSAQIVELLARPNLVDLPENPVGRIASMLLARYPGYRTVEVSEVIDAAAVSKLIDADADYLPGDAIHQISAGAVLRYDMTMPLLLASGGIGSPARVAALGLVYRNQKPGPTREQAFHQLELLAIDDRASLDIWAFIGQTLHILSDLLPGRNVLIEKVHYPTCATAWELSVEEDGKPICVLALGAYTPRIVEHFGCDPAIHAALGIGYGLDRMAAIHFGYDDIRKLPSARVAVEA